VHGRMGVSCLPGDQARAPARAAPCGADPLLLGLREHARASLGATGAISETGKRAPLRRTRLTPAMPPLTGCGRRDAMASRRLSHARSGLDRLHE